MRDFVLTSESVTMGHPDKLCDRISDAVVDAFLADGERVAVNAECALANGVVFLACRYSGEPPVDLAALARRAVAEAGYREPPFSPDATTVLTNVAELPPPDRSPAAPAHHAATVFGYACRHTEEMLPLPIAAAHRLARALDTARGGDLDWLTPDCQAQVAVRHKGRKPVAISAVMLTVGLREGAPSDDGDLTDALKRAVIEPAFGDLEVCPDGGTRVLISRATPIASGGPTAHAGLTGRKTAVDAYGGYSRQGTAAFSGKDPSRIDRTAAYAARHAAKCIVAAGLAEECEVQLSYAIGERDAISVEIDTYGTGRLKDEKLKARLAASFDFTAAGIAERLGLWSIAAERKGRFWRQLACYGHMGRTDIDAPWERTSEAAQLA